VEEQNKIYHLGLISIEIFKKDNKVRYQMTVPLGSSWQEAIDVCDEFKAAIVEMQKTALAQEQAKKDSEQVAVEPTDS
jgi:hypothetical protein